MMKRRIFMFLIAIWLAIIISACHQNVQPMVNEENPVIVDPPRVNMTVFTNWQEIRLTYTIRWLDGYEPLFEEARPENMSFAPFELDPTSGSKLELQNRREYKKENYIDAIYYLRHIGEKKGDIVILEQTFRYRKEEAGKTRESQEVYEVEAPGILLRYDSVLTKNADDIIDLIDFGSFKKQEYLWDGAIGGIAVIMCAILFLMFRNPVTLAKKTGKTKTISAGQTADEQEERLAPKYARTFLDNKLIRLQANLAADHPNSQKLRETITVICNELRRFFLSYVPDLGVSEFSYKEIRAKILLMPEKRKRDLLITLTNWLEYQENMLYREEIKGNLFNDIATMKKHVSDLNDWEIRLYNLRQKWQKIASLFSKIFPGVK